MVSPQSRPNKLKAALEFFGLDAKFSEKSLKQAFKSFVAIHHPDKPGGSHEVFLEATRIYEYLLAHLQTSKVRSVGEDIHIDINIDWKTFLYGSKVSVELSTTKQTGTCPECSGSGHKSSTRLSKCMFCLGLGYHTHKALGAEHRSSCEECSGTGKIRIGTCNKCNGSGTHVLEWTYEIELPPGLFPGNLLKFRGKGGPGEIPGDLTILINVRTPNNIELTADRILKRVEIDFASVACGGSYKVESLYGTPFIIKIPNTDQDRLVQVPEAGVKLPSAKFSPLWIEIIPYIPVNMSKRAALLLQELKSEWNPEG